MHAVGLSSVIYSVRCCTRAVAVNASTPLLSPFPALLQGLEEIVDRSRCEARLWYARRPFSCSVYGRRDCPTLLIYTKYQVCVMPGICLVYIYIYIYLVCIYLKCCNYELVWAGRCHLPDYLPGGYLLFFPFAVKSFFFLFSCFSLPPGA